MVRQVLQWSKANSKSDKNVPFNDPHFTTLRCLYKKVLKAIEEEKAPKSILAINKKVRVTLRQISQASGVDIEPAETTKLLDELVDALKPHKDILYASVPGAGGDDAIFLLAKKGSKNEKSLQDAVKEHFCN